MFEKFNPSSSPENPDKKVEEYRSLEAAAAGKAREIIAAEIDTKLEGHERWLAIINKAQEIADRGDQAERFIPEALIRFASFEKAALEQAALEENYPEEAALHKTLN